MKRCEWEILDGMDKKLDKILLRQGQIKTVEVKEMAALDDLKANVVTLTANVAQMKTVEESAVATLKGLTDQQAVLIQELADAIAANNPADIQAAADALAAQNQAVIDMTAQLAAAIPANTSASK